MICPVIFKETWMKRVKLIVGASLLFAGAASAQDAPDPAAPPPDGSTGAPMATAEVGVAPGAWSEAVIDQPMTLRAGKLAVYGNLDVARLSISDGMGNTASSTAEGLDVG